MTQIPCPMPAPHGTSCICNGSGEVRVQAGTALCDTCGDKTTGKNLGFVASLDGVTTGTACTSCGTVGDPVECARRLAELNGAVPLPVIAHPKPVDVADREPELRLVREVDGSMRVATVYFNDDDGEPSLIDSVVVLAARDATEFSALVIDIAGALDRRVIAVDGTTLTELPLAGQDLL